MESHSGSSFATVLRIEVYQRRVDFEPLPKTRRASLGSSYQFVWPNASRRVCFAHELTSISSASMKTLPARNCLKESNRNVPSRARGHPFPDRSNPNRRFLQQSRARFTICRFRRMLCSPAVTGSRRACKRSCRGNAKWRSRRPLRSMGSAAWVKRS
jgi:hypothetical protein